MSLITNVVGVIAQDVQFISMSSLRPLSTRGQFCSRFPRETPNKYQSTSMTSNFAGTTKLTATSSVKPVTALFRHVDLKPLCAVSAHPMFSFEHQLQCAVSHIDVCVSRTIDGAETARHTFCSELQNNVPKQQLLAEGELPE